MNIKNHGTGVRNYGKYPEFIKIISKKKVYKNTLKN